MLQFCDWAEKFSAVAFLPVCSQDTDADNRPPCWQSAIALAWPLRFDADTASRKSFWVAKTGAEEEFHVSIAPNIYSIAVVGTPNAWKIIEAIACAILL